MPPLFMTNPDLPDHAPAVTTQSAFDKVWSKKGWQLVTDQAAPAAPAPAPARSRTPAQPDAGQEG